MTDPDPEIPAHLKSAFAVRMGLYGLAVLGVAFNAPDAPATALGALLGVLAVALPVIWPVVAWLDWRWLRRNPDKVNRWGLRV